MFKKLKLERWISGTYGLKYPAVVCSADAVVWRCNAKNKVEILTGIRAPGRWQAGMTILAFGGFVDPSDVSPLDAALREVKEELPGLEFSVDDPNPIFVSGPAKFRYKWSPKKDAAIRTSKLLVQDIPVITITYLLQCNSYQPVKSTEIASTTWKNLFDEIESKEKTYAFDHALLIPYLLEHFTRYLLGEAFQEGLSGSSE